MNKSTTSNQCITIIAAIAENGAIGFENHLLYHLPNDMQRFRQLTTGHTVVMGRHTWESLPQKPLPNRRNIVLSRTATQGSLAGCEVYASLTEVLRQCPDDEIFIIGGAQIYREAMDKATRLCLTIVKDTPPHADTFFPDYGDEWVETLREEHYADEKHAYAYTFMELERRS